jgi:hypothetical protein
MRFIIEPPGYLPVFFRFSSGTASFYMVYLQTCDTPKNRRETRCDLQHNFRRQAGSLQQADAYILTTPNLYANFTRQQAIHQDSQHLSQPLGNPTIHPITQPFSPSLSMVLHGGCRRPPGDAEHEDHK